MTLPAVLLAVAAAVSSPQKPVLAVEDFQNNSGKAELDVLGKGLADMIITDLVAWDGVAVVERERLEAVKKELDLQKSKRFDPATAVRVGKLVQASYMLLGGFSVVGERLRIDARLTKVATGEIVATASDDDLKDKVFDAEQRLVDKITARIDLKVKDPSARRKAKAPSLEALLAYSQAIDLSDQGKLEEAQKAIAALVSKSPGYLMAREKKQQILERLKEIEKRRGDLITASALELGKLADAELAKAGDFASLDAVAQRRLLSMRAVKGAFLARLLKQQLSWRRESFRVILPGREAKALEVMRAWVENQRSLMREQGAYERLTNDSWPSPEVEPQVVGLMRDARMGEVQLRDPLEALVGFVVRGRLRDGDSTYAVAPTYGDLRPKEREATLAQLEESAAQALGAAASADVARKPAAENRAIGLLDLKAEALQSLGLYEEAIGEYQRILDAFPTSSRAERYERDIKKLIGAEHDDARNKRERWAKTMGDGCADDMDLRVAAGTALHDRMRHLGLRGLAAHAEELEKACKVTRHNRSAIASVYRDLALEAAYHEDCAGFRSWFRKYLEADGSVSDMMGYQKNYTPWCELGDVTKEVLWLHARLDGSWDIEMEANLTSVLSYDGKMLSLNGRKDQGDESLALYLDSTGKGVFECRQAQWRRSSGETLEGRCTAKVTKLADDQGGFDEGSFSATFEIPGEKRSMTMSEGAFRLRRQ